jgi:hypothetical protein
MERVGRRGGWMGRVLRLMLVGPLLLLLLLL